jgi:hypothetical protein
MTADEGTAEAQPNREAGLPLALAKPHCKGTTKAGKPCQSTVLVDDNHCLVHSSRRFDPVEAGRKGGQKSAIVRRSHAKNGGGKTRDGRVLLREVYEGDHEFRAKVKASYEDGLTAMKTCGGCGGAMADHRTRIAAGDSLMAQIYGKPMQTIQAKHEQPIIVVSRLAAALDRAAEADVDLLAADVRELEAG